MWVSEPCFVSVTLIMICDRVLVGGVDVLVSTHRQPSSMECRSWLIWQTVSAQIEITSVEFILIMRGKNPKYFYVHAFLPFPLISPRVIR